MECGFEPTVSTFPTPVLAVQLPTPLQDDLCPYVETLMNSDSSSTKQEPQINKRIRTGYSQIGSHLIPLLLIFSLPDMSWGAACEPVKPQLQFALEGTSVGQGGTFSSSTSSHLLSGFLLQKSGKNSYFSNWYLMAERKTLCHSIL